MPGTLPLAIAASMITIMTVALVLLTLRLGRILEQLDTRQEERRRRTIVERARQYGHVVGSGAQRAAHPLTQRQPPPPG